MVDGACNTHMICSLYFLESNYLQTPSVRVQPTPSPAELGRGNPLNNQSLFYSIFILCSSLSCGLRQENLKLKQDYGTYFCLNTILVSKRKRLNNLLEYKWASTRKQGKNSAFFTRKVNWCSADDTRRDIISNHLVKNWKQARWMEQLVQKIRPVQPQPA